LVLKSTSISGDIRECFDQDGKCIWPKEEDMKNPQSAFVQDVYLAQQISVNSFILFYFARLIRSLQFYFAPEHYKLLDLITHLLEFDPQKRITATNALRIYFGDDKLSLFDSSSDSSS
jgi:hypothetical protein